MSKYGESKTTRIMMATVPHVISGLGLRKFQADGFLLTRVYINHKGHFTQGKNVNFRGKIEKYYIFFIHGTFFVLGGLWSGLIFFYFK